MQSVDHTPIVFFAMFACEPTVAAARHRRVLACSGRAALAFPSACGREADSRRRRHLVTGAWKYWRAWIILCFYTVLFTPIVAVSMAFIPTQGLPDYAELF